MPECPLKCVCRSDRIASGAAIWDGLKLRALERCIIKVEHAGKSRAAPKEGSQSKAEDKALKKNNRTRVATDGDEEVTGYVSAGCAHGGSVCLRGSEAFHARSVDVVHLDPERVTLCRGVYVCDSGAGLSGE